MRTLARNFKSNVLRTAYSLLLLFLMIPGVLAQESVPDEGLVDFKLDELFKTNPPPDKSTTYSLNVIGSDALIHGKTVGRGSGNLSYNSAFGTNTLLSNISGNYNSAFGTVALYSNTTGNSNAAFGAWTLAHNTTGLRNTAIGTSALYGNQTGSYNSAFGSNTLYTNTSGYRNTAVGFESLFANTIGYWNTATGSNSLLNNTTGTANTATGYDALSENTIDNWNTAFGKGALRDLKEGSENTGIGESAGGNFTNISRGTFLGSLAYPNTNNLTNVTGIGYNVKNTASNQVRIGNASVTSIGGSVNWTADSDGSYKNNIEEDVAGLDFILKLRPVSYNLDIHKIASDLGENLTRDEDGSKANAVPDETTQKSRDEKAAIRYTGFIAQEVEATVNDLGVAFSGVDAPTNKSGYYGLRYADFVVPLVRAVQEQQAQIEALSPEGFDALREELSELRQANEQLLAAEASLRAENEVLSQRQSLLEAENESIRGQVTDILSMLETLGVDMQDCCHNQTTGHNHGTSSQNQMPDNARLEQNTPNPFHENTLIRYFLPEGTHRAQIIITDMAGTQVMALPLEHQGAGQALIHGGTLPSGTYVYTLTVNGRKVDSKRMVLL